SELNPARRGALRPVGGPGFFSLPVRAGRPKKRNPPYPPLFQDTHTMLDANLKKQLDTYLQNIVKPIEISVSGADSPKGKELYELAAAIAAMSGKTRLTDAADKRTPSMGVAAGGAVARVRFAGIPLGHEFTALVLALLQAGGHPSKADPALLEQ